MVLTSEYTFWIIYIFLSYLFCSIPFGKIISRKVAGIDITQRGSRNIGATNVARELGFKWGIFTLVFDALKGFIPITLFNFSFPNFGIGGSLIGLASLLGHQFSIYQRFRGGKGGATAFGAMLGMGPLAALIIAAVWLVIARVFKVSSLAALTAALLAPVLLWWFALPLVYVVAVLVMAALLIVRHRSNIQRLLAGTESQISNKT